MLWAEHWGHNGWWAYNFKEGIKAKQWCNQFSQANVPHAQLCTFPDEGYLYHFCCWGLGFTLSDVINIFLIDVLFDPSILY